MARNGSYPSCCSVGPALATLPPALLGDVRVFVRKGMSSQAVSLSALTGAVRRAAQRKSLQIAPLLWSQKIVKRCRTTRMAILDCVGFEPAVASEIGQQVGHTFDGDALSDAPVALALGSGDPAAIRGFIVPVVVDAVDEVSGGPVAHVGNERTKITQPSVTHSDAAPAVVLELGISRVVAAAKHALPHGVQRMGILERHSCVPFWRNTSMKRIG